MVPVMLGPACRITGMAAIAAFKESLVQFNQILQDGDKQAIPFYQEAALDRVGDIEEAMVKGFPFEVSSRSSHSHLPTPSPVYLTGPGKSRPADRLAPGGAGGTPPPPGPVGQTNNFWVPDRLPPSPSSNTCMPPAGASHHRRHVTTNRA